MPNHHELFLRRTSDQFRSMARRVSELTDKRGRLIRVGRTLPFTLPEYRGWVLKQLRGAEEGCGLCAYCKRWIDAGTLVPDHKDPLARGGSLALDNLAPSCAPCNHRKGKMSAAGFEYLLACAAKLSEPDRTDLMQRLEIAVQLAAQRRWQGRKPKQKPEEEPF
jgi:5-methylcytosine-specific restriction endonuclease McrA